MRMNFFPIQVHDICMTAVCFVSGNFWEHATRRNRQIWTDISPKSNKTFGKNIGESTWTGISPAAGMCRTDISL